MDYPPSSSDYDVAGADANASILGMRTPLACDTRPLAECFFTWRFKVANLDLNTFVNQGDFDVVAICDHISNDRGKTGPMRSQIVTASFLVLGDCASSLLANAEAIAQGNC